MRIAVYGRSSGSTQVDFARHVIESLLKREYSVTVYESFYSFLSQKGNFAQPASVFQNFSDINNKVDFLFSIGGDGTLLDTVLLVKDSGIPVVGVNAGRLGFLSGISRENFEEALTSLEKGFYSTDSRTLLRLESNKAMFEGSAIALNDFTVHKQDTSSMITIHAYLNGEYLNSYWADGLIIATPTGSTGYSLSCGGPILVPQSESFVITPIAPHNLNVRPIVVSDKNVISLEVEGRGQRFMATMDSRYATIDSSCQIAIRKESFHVNLVRLSNENFLTTLRNKLNWGLDSRN